MSEHSLDVLSVIGEAVVIARGGKIVFANAPASAILGNDTGGKTVSEIFGAEVSVTPSDEFTASVFLNGKNCILRVSRQNSEQIFVINEIRTDIMLINDAFLYSLRSCLMVMNISAERSRRFAEESGREELLTQADLMSRSLAAASRLVTNITDVCGIRSQTLRFSPKPLNVSRLFREYTDIAASLLPEVEISFEAPENLHSAVDPDLIKHLLSNLISNAVLHGKCRRLRIRLIESTEYIILALNDDGCGIRSDELYNIFERYLGTIELSDVSRGAGLGLSAVMGIAQLHGGTVILESSASHGTAVRVSLRKNTAGSTFCSSAPSTEDARDFLIGLADCVDEKRFRETYSE